MHSINGWPSNLERRDGFIFRRLDEKLSYHRLEASGSLTVENAQRAHSPQLATGLASELSSKRIPCVRSSSQQGCEELR